jgi:nicotinamidase-related amidase
MDDDNSDLHGNAPDDSPVALMLIDLINDLEFPGGQRLLQPALNVIDNIAALKRRARASGIPVIYANDNFGRWRSDFREVVEHCLRDDVTGRPVVEKILPEPDDYFVLKPKHSAFFATTLETLLAYLGVRRLVLTGISTEICVTFTALDAYMRDFELYIPSDCVISDSDAKNFQALEYLRRVCAVDTTPSTELDLDHLRRGVAA